MHSCSHNTFESLIRNKIPTVVLFYMDGCTHCKNMQPEWTKFYENHKQHPERIDNNEQEPEIIQIENDELQKFMGENGNHGINIMGYPTIMSILDKKKEVYEGERNVEGFESFFKNVMKDMGETRPTLDNDNQNNNNNDNNNDNNDNDNDNYNKYNNNENLVKYTIDEIINDSINEDNVNNDYIVTTQTGGYKYKPNRSVNSRKLRSRKRGKIRRRGKSKTRKSLKKRKTRSKSQRRKRHSRKRK